MRTALWDVPTFESVHGRKLHEDSAIVHETPPCVLAPSSTQKRTRPDLRSPGNCRETAEESELDQLILKGANLWMSEEQVGRGRQVRSRASLRAEEEARICAGPRTAEQQEPVQTVRPRLSASSVLLYIGDWSGLIYGEASVP